MVKRTSEKRANGPIDDELKTKIEERLKTGLPVSTVATEFEVSWSTVDRIRRKLGLKKHPHGINLLKADKETEDKILFELRREHHGSDPAIASKLGVSRDAVKRIREREGIAAYAPGGEHDNRLRRIALEDENSKLRNELKSIHRAQLDEDAFRKILGTFSSHTPEPPKWMRDATTKNGVQAETPVAIWADWHYGETVSADEVFGINQYNIEIAENRARTLVEKTIALCRNHHNPAIYPGFVLNLNGDFISGAIHPELEKTDEEEQIPSALRCSDILIWCISELLEEFKSVYVATACGNHARNSAKPEMKRRVYNSFDWLIYQILIRYFHNEKNVVIHCRKENETYYRVYNQRYLNMHGDTMGVRGGDGIIGSLGPICRGEFKIGKQSQAIGRDFDRLLLAHWHREIHLPSVVVPNAFKGWDEYARIQLRAPPSTPSQPLWFVHPEQPETGYFNVTLEEPKSAVVDKWVSFPAQDESNHRFP